MIEKLESLKGIVMGIIILIIALAEVGVISWDMSVLIIVPITILRLGFYIVIGKKEENKKAIMYNSVVLLVVLMIFLMKIFR